MQARADRQQGQRETVRLALDAARWGFSRNIEPVEVLSVTMALCWLTALAAGGVFGTASSYLAMSRVTGWVSAYGWQPEWPWAIVIGFILVYPLIAYTIATWGYLRKGEWDNDAPQVFWARRLRFAGLVLLSGWWMFIAIMFGTSNFDGVGWRIYVPLALWTSWSALRLVWEYGGAVIPLTGERR